MLSKKVFFISQAEAERLEPVPGAAMISITDPDKSPAALGQWGQLYRDSFYDGGYSENTIHTMKAAFRMNYASYIDSSQAEKLSTFLDGRYRSDLRSLLLRRIQKWRGSAVPPEQTWIHSE